MAFGQTADTRPKFAAADARAAEISSVPSYRIIPVHDGRYEIKGATMLDMVRLAYGFDQDKIMGGPSWLEMSRYDIIGKLPDQAASPDDQKLMLQTLLEDRFQLKVHKDTQPLKGYVVTGKKPHLKEAGEQEASGCNPQSSSGPAPEGGGRLGFVGPNGTPVMINLGPGAAITYNCRAMTMAAFAAGMRGMFGSNVGTVPVKDETGLEGKWDFDVTYSLRIGVLGWGGDEEVTLAQAVEKLGLKLEERQIPTPVLVVDSVNEKPSANAPDLAKILPPLAPPTVFEVASIKPTDPSFQGGRFGTQPGGKFVTQGMPMRTIVMQAFRQGMGARMPQITGLPKWADSDRFDITAKTPPDTATLDMFSLGPPLRALLAERFKMTYHTEDQPGTAYNLQAAKPKMKKADPAGRTSCQVSSPAGSPSGTEMIQCRNIAMGQFVDWLNTRGPGLQGPVSDETALDGAWDFELTFSLAATRMAFGPGDAPGAGRGAGAGAQAPEAADPQSGYTLAEAMEKQLGLKLETTKKPQPTIVIDHIEEKPTEDQ